MTLAAASQAAVIPLFNKFVRFSDTPFPNTNRITPSAARRSANGSFDPVGFSSIAQNRVSVSILSASATATETGSVGTESLSPFGRQWSRAASATEAFSPASSA